MLMELVLLASEAEGMYKRGQVLGFYVRRDWSDIDLISGDTAVDLIPISV